MSTLVHKFLKVATSSSIWKGISIFFSLNNNLSFISSIIVNPVHRDFYDEEMLVDNLEDEVIRKPDIVKKQRLMDTQHDYFDFQAKKNAMLKNVPVR